jgi:hypothetical protein
MNLMYDKLKPNLMQCTHTGEHNIYRRIQKCMRTIVYNHVSMGACVCMCVCVGVWWEAYVCVCVRASDNYYNYSVLT